MKVRYLQRELRKTLDRADLLITDSEFTRHELADFSGLSLDKIRAIPLASSAEFKPASADALQEFSDKYQLSYQGYCLFVGTIEPRKNILTLLRAYKLLSVDTRRRWPLILTGYSGWQNDEIHAQIKKAEREGWARYLGFLPAEDLPSLYAGARLFAFPSYYEGFGLPVLEAMSSGVPVVCSNSSSLPEVAGGAALLSDPDDVQKLTEHLQIGLEDLVWRDQAIINGLSHASQFSWEKCSAETLLAYKRLAD